MLRQLVEAICTKCYANSFKGINPIIFLSSPRHYRLIVDQTGMFESSRFDWTWNTLKSKQRRLKSNFVQSPACGERFG